MELLAPFQPKLIVVRKTVRGDEPVETHANSELPKLLPRADHVVNILPSTPETDGFFKSDLFAQMKPGAVFYNIGRGTTADEDALAAALKSNHLRAAYLDVTNPEPLPPDHPLWSAPNCHITPHTAGGHGEEFVYTVRHFLANLKRYESAQPLLDRVI